MVHEVFDIAARSASRDTDDDWLLRVVKSGARGESAEELHLASSALHWYNRPHSAVRVERESGNLLVHADGGADFWQRSGGESADDGHFLHIEAPQLAGERIVASTLVSIATPEAGDRVGLMVRRGPTAWVTAALGKGIGGGEGGLELGSMVTNNGVSDYAPSACGGCASASLRLTVDGDDVRIEASLDPLEREGSWRLLRLGRLEDAGDETDKSQVAVGIFAAAPGRAGMVAALGYFSVVRVRKGDHIAEIVSEDD